MSSPAKNNILRRLVEEESLVDFDDPRGKEKLAEDFKLWKKEKALHRSIVQQKEEKQGIQIENELEKAEEKTREKLGIKFLDVTGAEVEKEFGVMAAYIANKLIHAPATCVRSAPMYFINFWDATLNPKYKNQLKENGISLDKLPTMFRKALINTNNPLYKDALNSMLGYVYYLQSQQQTTGPEKEKLLAQCVIAWLQIKTPDFVTSWLGTIIGDVLFDQENPRTKFLGMEFILLHHTSRLLDPRSQQILFDRLTAYFRSCENPANLKPILSFMHDIINSIKFLQTSWLLDEVVLLDPVLGNRLKLNAQKTSHADATKSYEEVVLADIDELLKSEKYLEKPLEKAPGLSPREERVPFNKMADALKRLRVNLTYVDSLQKLESQVKNKIKDIEISALTSSTQCSLK